MAVSVIRADSDLLYTDASAVKTSIRQLTQNITKLSNLCATMNTMWEGPASTAFGATFEKEIERLNALRAKLEKLNQYEIEAKTSYDKCEREVHDITSSLRW